jgi:hypothetical protein
MSMNGSIAPEDEGRVESSLRAAIKLNPSFAASYNALAMFLGMRHRDLDEARMMALNAVQLEPENLSYRLNTASVLMAMERGKDAVAVVRNAMHLAKSEEETKQSQNFLQRAEDYAERQERDRQFSERMKADATSGVRANSVNVTRPDFRQETAPSGSHHFMVGVLNNVRCETPAMNLKVVSGTKSLDLHSGNYYKIEYSSLGIKISANFNPCRDLEGRPAKVEYVEPAEKNAAAWVVGIEIHK